MQSYGRNIHDPLRNGNWLGDKGGGKVGWGRGAKAGVESQVL